MKSKVRVMFGLLAVVGIAVGGVTAAPLSEKMERSEVVAGPVQSCSNGQIARLLWKANSKADQSLSMPGLRQTGTLSLELISAEKKVTIVDFPTETEEYERYEVGWSGSPETLIVLTGRKLFRFLPESRTFSEFVAPIPNAVPVSWTSSQSGEIAVLAAVRNEQYSDPFLDRFDAVASLTIHRWNLDSGSVDTSVTIPFAHRAALNSRIDCDGSDPMSPDAGHVLYQKNASDEGRSQSPDTVPNPIQITDIRTSQTIFSQYTTGTLSGTWWSPDGTKCLVNVSVGGMWVGDCNLWIVDLATKKLDKVGERIAPAVGSDMSHGFSVSVKYPWVGGERFLILKQRGTDIDYVVDTETWDVTPLPTLGEKSSALLARTKPLVALKTVCGCKDNPRVCIVRIGPDLNDGRALTTEVRLESREEPEMLWNCDDTKLLLINGHQMQEVAVP